MGMLLWLSSEAKGTSYGSDFHFRVSLPLGVHLTEARPLEFEISVLTDGKVSGR